MPASAHQTNDHPLIVGIGASAGGLEAFTHFFEHMPADNEMVFVLVQHLAPQHTSMLAELLSRCTEMSVVEAADGDPLHPRHVYVIPPDATLTVSDGHLRVTRPAPPRQHRWPIDTLFVSLAEEYGEYAVCVVLAGSGSDGARGLRAVKEHGGLTLAQAGSDHVAMIGMPANAVATGLVDQILPVEEMPARLIAHERLLRATRDNRGGDGTRVDVGSNLQTICNLLRSETGHDFNQYKEKTLIRRIQRRMQVAQVTDVQQYIEYLRNTPAEYDLLFHELLISVTEFFRDPAAFEVLATQAIPRILAGMDATDTVRIWVAGCATGEEAYSIAIAFREAMPTGKSTPKILIFATDIDGRAIEIARAGRYRAPLHGVSAQRRERWFNEDGDDLVVVKQIREMCVFSPQSVIKDPPFSRIDLITCRNLLIYLNVDAQRRLARIFHYALNPGGFLLLGPSESVSRNPALFTAVDTRHRIYQRRDDINAGPLELPSTARRNRSRRELDASQAVSRPASDDTIDRIARQAMEKYSPAYVVIDEQRDIIRFAGDTGKFLGPSSGAASLNLFTLLHKGLRNATRQAVNQAYISGKAVVADQLVAAWAGQQQRLRLIVEPLPATAAGAAAKGSRLCAVAFLQIEQAKLTRQVGAGAESGDSDRLLGLEHELETTRAQLRSAIDQADAAGEELKSANEEYQSVNEELQSSNEELETSKEEMQSINEELQTVNTELHSKNDTLAHLNSDLRNLLDSTRIATLFLDESLRVRRFTPAMTDLFHLRDSDQGRPITEISPSIQYAELRADVNSVLRNLGTVERLLQTGQGDANNTFLLRMRPYRTVENVIDGVVLTFVDVTESQRLNQEHARLAAIVNSSKDAIIGVSLEDRITSWNPAATRMFGIAPADAIGKPLALLLPRDATAQMKSFFAPTTLQQHRGEITLNWLRADGSSIPLELIWTPVCSDDGKTVIASDVVARDLSERRRAKIETDLMMRELDHRVKNTLATVQAIAHQSLAKANGLEEFRNAFTSRLMALSKTHSLLARQTWSGADLQEIVRSELMPYLDAGMHRVQIHGEAVRLTPKFALALAMALHELTTNAVKYGALSSPAGTISVNWKIRRVKGHDWLHLLWSEHGGPVVSKPQELGFGHRLITDGLALELDGKVELEFESSGVTCKISVPLPSPTSSKKVREHA